MTSTGIPEDVKSFLESSVDSLEQLSVLLLLFSDSDRAWTSTEISRELRSSEQSIEARLAGLYRRNVLRRIPDLVGRHRFNPAPEELRRLVARLAEVNRIRPYGVIEAIYGSPSTGIQSFLSAFRLKDQE